MTMKSRERYEKELEKFGMCDDDALWRYEACFRNPCEGCRRRYFEWCERKAKPEITEFEKEVLKKIGWQFKYIARDQYGRLFLYCEKPKKEDERWVPISLFTALPLTGLFDWIQFEDSEPVCIDDFVER